MAFNILTTRQLLFKQSSISNAARIVSRRLLTASAVRFEPTEGERLIIDKLTQKFVPSKLDVQDVSGGCGTFYAINIESLAFKGLSKLKQHRLVTTELKEDIEGIHGLQLKTDAPPEP